MSLKKVVLYLYHNSSDEIRVLCYDEFGPLEIRPQPGENWGKIPDRIPANYSRTHGVRHLLAILDLRSNKIYAHVKRRKRWREFLAFLKYVRSIFTEKLYIILDNFSPHIKEEVTDWCRDNNVFLEFLPTNASWLNKIESHFTAIKKFAIRNSNYSSHKELRTGIRRYISWRNNNTDNQELKRIEKRYNFS